MAGRQLFLGTVFNAAGVQENSVRLDGEDNAPSAPESLRNLTEQTLGFGDEWSLSLWADLDSFASPASRRLLRIGDGDPNQINLQLRVLSGGRNIMDLLIRNTSGTQTTLTYGNDQFGPKGWIINNWAHYFVVRESDGTIRYWLDTSERSPDSGNPDGISTMADTARAIELGVDDTISFDGNISQLALWNVDVSSALDAIYNGGNPNAIDLNAAFGDTYTFAGNLAHWWRPGVDADNLGRDYALSGLTPLIDIDEDASNLDNITVEASVPS